MICLQLVPGGFVLRLMLARGSFSGRSFVANPIVWSLGMTQAAALTSSQAVGYRRVIHLCLLFLAVFKASFS